MQDRMIKYSLTRTQAENLLEKEHLGHLGTLSTDGAPYITPVHFVFLEGEIYIHGLNRGEKVENIKRDQRVCLEVTGPFSYIQADAPCDTNTAYSSVIVKGTATIVQSEEELTTALDAIVLKYTPKHTGKAFPPSMLEMTGVIRIKCTEITGKYYGGGE